MISVKNLCYSVRLTKGRREILKGVSFEARSRRLAVIGPNGSGKTTLIRVLAGELTPTEGAISFDHSLSWMRPAMVPQKPDEGLWEDLTVRETLLLATGRGRLLWHGYRDWGYCEREMPWIPSVLNERAETIVGKLSGGERQILLLVTALASAGSGASKNPVLLVDEFTASLDPGNTDRARSALKKALQTVLKGGCFIFSTHSYSEMREFAEEVIALERGQVRWLRPVEEITAEKFLEVYEA